MSFQSVPRNPQRIEAFDQAFLIRGSLPCLIRTSSVNLVGCQDRVRKLRFPSCCMFFLMPVLLHSVFTVFEVMRALVHNRQELSTQLKTRT